MKIPAKDKQKTRKVPEKDQQKTSKRPERDQQKTRKRQETDQQKTRTQTEKYQKTNSKRLSIFEIPDRDLSRIPSPLTKMAVSVFETYRNSNLQPYSYGYSNYNWMDIRVASRRTLPLAKEAGLLGPTKSRLGSNLAVFGLKLGQTGAHLGSTWA